LAGILHNVLHENGPLTVAACWFHAQVSEKRSRKRQILDRALYIKTTWKQAMPNRKLHWFWLIRNSVWLCLMILTAFYVYVYLSQWMNLYIFIWMNLCRYVCTYVRTNIQWMIFVYLCINLSPKPRDNKIFVEPVCSRACIWIYMCI
jgi:hypothetical protein